MRFKSLISFVFLFFIACGSSQGVSPRPDPAVAGEVPFITLRTIDDEGKGQVEIPLSIFDNDETLLLNNTSMDVELVGVTSHGNLNPKEFYVSEVKRVAFFMHGIEDGDEIVVRLRVSSDATNVTTPNSTDTLSTLSSKKLSISAIPDESANTNVSNDDTGSVAEDTELTPIGPNGFIDQTATLSFRGKFSDKEDTAAVLEALDLSGSVDSTMNDNYNTLNTGDEVSITPIL